MKFVDQARITVRSGNGGRGCVSFRREKYVPRGGPDGGDGGDGGDVVLAADSQKDTLLHFHFNQRFKAEDGRPGSGSNCHGANGEDRLVLLPPGTMVFDLETDELLVDLDQPGKQHIVARGGQGGRGNKRFVSSINRAPRRSDPGLPGQELRLRLELKLLADVGLVGLPNAGKSTLISRLSAARPKIADYPFTTLIPNLGVVAVDDEHSFVLADIPGLIEGASQGSGLGHQFLRHIERCRVLVHMVDGMLVDPNQPLALLETIEAELGAFDPALAAKPRLVAVNKVDLPEAAHAADLIAAALPGTEVHRISALTGLNLAALKFAMYQRVSKARADDESAESHE